MKVLIVGATGKYASHVIPELKQRGVTIRALVRHQDKLEAARQKGADEAVVGDLGDADSLHAAASGVEGVFHLNPAFAPNEAELGVAMVEAATAAGVRKFVFSSVIHPSISALSNHAAKRPVEEALCESGMQFIILQPTMFMQNFDSGWQAVMEKGRFALPYSKHAKASYVDYRDVAEVAAIALTSDRLDYGTFELCDAGMVDRVQLTALMSEALDRPIAAGAMTFEEWAQIAQLPGGAMRDGMQKMYAHYDRYGFPGGNAVVLQAILGREPRSLRQYFYELASHKISVPSSSRSS
jgi:uncharacterized protein YbjT (DUF2867 family)